MAAAGTRKSVLDNVLPLDFNITNDEDEENIPPQKVVNYPDSDSDQTWDYDDEEYLDPEEAHCHWEPDEGPSGVADSVDNVFAPSLQFADLLAGQTDGTRPAIHKDIANLVNTIWLQPQKELADTLWPVRPMPR